MWYDWENKIIRKTSNFEFKIQMKVFVRFPGSKINRPINSSYSCFISFFNFLGEWIIVTMLLAAVSKELYT